MKEMFKVGKRYETESGRTVDFEIIARTSKTVTYTEIKHAGRYNEQKSEPKKAIIKPWGDREAFITKWGDTVVS